MNLGYNNIAKTAPFCSINAHPFQDQNIPNAALEVLLLLGGSIFVDFGHSLLVVEALGDCARALRDCRY